MIAELPPSPCQLMGSCNLFKRVPLRRALLQELGPNDPKLNLKMAESLLTISAQRFREKWNFDPITMKPRKGNYVWTPLKKEPTSRQGDQDKDSRLLCDDRLSPPDAAKPESSSSDDHSSDSRLSCLVGLSPEEDASPAADRLSVHGSSSSTAKIGSDNNSESPKTKKSYQKSTRRVLGLARQSKPTFIKPRQCKITEYGRQRKRVNSKSEDDLEKSPRKKMILDSPVKGTTNPLREHL